MPLSDLMIPGVTDPADLACIARSRGYDQYVTMVDNALRGKCPFCPPDPVNKIVENGEGWHAWQNPYPEKHTKHHFVIASKSHVLNLLDLKWSERIELFSILHNLQVQFGYKSCGIQIRDGDATLSAGTIQHLHVHVMVPDGTGRVESPFYKGRADEEAGIKRAVIYEKLRQGASQIDLAEDEKSLVDGRI